METMEKSMNILRKSMNTMEKSSKTMENRWTVQMAIFSSKNQQSTGCCLARTSAPDWKNKKNCTPLLYIIIFTNYSIWCFYYIIVLNLYYIIVYVVIFCYFSNYIISHFALLYYSIYYICHQKDRQIAYQYCGGMLLSIFWWFICHICSFNMCTHYL
jgi:hypothetical protein